MFAYRVQPTKTVTVSVSVPQGVVTVTVNWVVVVGCAFVFGDVEALTNAAGAHEYVYAAGPEATTSLSWLRLPDSIRLGVAEILWDNGAAEIEVESEVLQPLTSVIVTEYVPTFNAVAVDVV